ncbi:MAG: M14 metallopeptidase family protein [Leeuwenhoekiella sp.]
MKEFDNYRSFLDWHGYAKEARLYGRYITYDKLEPIIKSYAGFARIAEVGKSVNGESITLMKVGRGAIKVLLWSQMHGNESTTTKAVFDLLEWLRSSETEAAAKISETFTLAIIPMLNPDGAKAYTRVNAKKVDLNRDAKERTQPESRALRQVYDRFRPDYCLNLHGQRSIFSLGKPPVSATVSFLSPSQDAERSITPTRKKAMSIITGLNHLLQDFIPNGVGRYDDGFNINCVGDMFQSLGTPTLLFEAGHYKQDYQRERTRSYIFLSLIKVFDLILNPLEAWTVQDYETIPENEKCFYDIIVRNVQIEGKQILDIAIQFTEKLQGDKIVFIPVIQKIRKLDDYQGHKEYDVKGEVLTPAKDGILEVGQELHTALLPDNTAITFSLNIPN